MPPVSRVALDRPHAVGKAVTAPTCPVCGVSPCCCYVGVRTGTHPQSAKTAMTYARYARRRETMADVIKVDDVPGLAVFIEDWLDDLDSPEDFCWPWYRRCTAPGCVPYSGVGCAACGGCGLVVVLPLSVPAARDALVRWFAAGDPCVRCEMNTCGGHPDAPKDCDGWFRQPADLSWARDIPGALAKSLRLVLKGKLLLRGVLGEWEEFPLSEKHRQLWHRERVSGERGQPHVMDEWGGIRLGKHGWMATNGQAGPEVLDAGKAAADASVIDMYWLEGGPFRLEVK